MKHQKKVLIIFLFICMGWFITSLSLVSVRNKRKLRGENDITLDGTKYEWKKDLGEGSFGLVILATNTIGGKQYAIKLQEIDTYKQISAYLKEIEISNIIKDTIENEKKRKSNKSHKMYENNFGIALKSGNVQRCKNKFGAILMNYMPNVVSFAELNSPSRQEKRLAYIVQIAKLLNWLNNKARIQHLDLKFENMRINKNNEIAIIDFGLSQHFLDKDCIEGYRGTLYYMPPETYFNSQICPTSDAYTFGIILIQIFELNNKFRDELNSIKKEFRHIEDSIAEARKLNNRVKQVPIDEFNSKAKVILSEARTKFLETRKLLIISGWNRVGRHLTFKEKDFSDIFHIDPYKRLSMTTIYKTLKKANLEENVNFKILNNNSDYTSNSDYSSSKSDLFEFGRSSQFFKKNNSDKSISSKFLDVNFYKNKPVDDHENNSILRSHRGVEIVVGRSEDFFGKKPENIQNNDVKPPKKQNVLDNFLKYIKDNILCNGANYSEQHEIIMN